MALICLVVVLVALHMLVIGYLIRYHGMVEIIAGYDPRKVTDKQGLARWVGANFLLMGVSGLFSGALGLILPEIAGMLAMIYFAMIGILSLRTSLGCKKYEKT